MRLVLEYIRSKRRSVIAFAIAVTIFLVVFYLMDIPLKVIWYPALICVLCAVIYAAIDFNLYRRKHNALVNAMNNIDVTTDNLPVWTELIERDYQELLSCMLKQKNNKLQDIREAREETTEYVAMWTHQIKTPLTALQLTAGTVPEPVHTELMARLFEIENYVDTMLQFVRLEGNVNDLVLKPYNLKSMVNQAVKYFARIFITKNLQVQINVPDELEIVTDEKWFVFVLKQLISNALKYTEKGAVSISAVKDDNKVTLTIEDTGIGIAPEDLPRIFERGYTGYNGRKDKKASGLGLYLTKRITKLLSQSITITSIPAKGTKVTLQI